MFDVTSAQDDIAGSSEQASLMFSRSRQSFFSDHEFAALAAVVEEESDEEERRLAGVIVPARRVGGSVYQVVALLDSEGRVAGRKNESLEGVKSSRCPFGELRCQSDVCHGIGRIADRPSTNCSPFLFEARNCARVNFGNLARRERAFECPHSVRD